ncbi:hypothetical protein BGP75_12835 [Motiliproteus sp. MSK22-1]|nr:hypothetical protein BGP75_12835 [Motiliproteus sp. MSK22-1]
MTYQIQARCIMTPCLPDRNKVTDTERSTGFQYGVGAQYQIDNNIAARLMVKRVAKWGFL